MNLIFFSVDRGINQKLRALLQKFSPFFRLITRSSEKILDLSHYHLIFNAFQDSKHSKYYTVSHFKRRITLNFYGVDIHMTSHSIEYKVDAQSPKF